MLYISGQKLAIAGPGSLFIAYVFMGTVMYSVIVEFLVFPTLCADLLDHHRRND